MLHNKAKKSTIKLKTPLLSEARNVTENPVGYCKQNINDVNTTI